MNMLDKRGKMSKNIEKQERYIILKSKLKKAMTIECWFEACMIEYAIIEDRTSSILYHAGICENAYSSSKKLSNKLSSIEYQIGKEHAIISKKVNKEIIEQIRCWKDKRNDFVHRSCVLFDEEKAKEVAQEGLILVNKISNDSAKVMRAAEKVFNK